MHEIFNPALRGRITRALSKPGSTWRGRYSGVRCVFVHSPQPALDGNRIEFQAAFAGLRLHDIAGSVYEATQEIQSAVDKYRYANTN